jgi:hypothetical protein
MSDESARLLAEWQKVHDEANALAADYFVVETVQPGQDIRPPRKVLTPEALEAIEAARQREADAWASHAARFARMIATGKLRAVKLGPRQTRIPISAIESLADT